MLSNSSGKRWFFAVNYFLEHKIVGNFLTMAVFQEFRAKVKVKHCQAMFICCLIFNNY